MKLLSVYLSPVSCYSIHLRPQYTTQTAVVQNKSSQTETQVLVTHSLPTVFVCTKHDIVSTN